MLIQFDKFSKRVVGATTNFDSRYFKPEADTSLEIDTFDFTFPIDEYIVDNGTIVHVGKSAETLAKEVEAHMKTLEGMIDPHIMKPIIEYNQTNGLRFDSPQNCELWSRDNTYEHQAFCLSAWEYHKNVYKTVRAYQLTATTVPTIEEFQAVLDSVVF